MYRSAAKIALKSVTILSEPVEVHQGFLSRKKLVLIQFQTLRFGILKSDNQMLRDISDLYNYFNHKTKLAFFFKEFATIRIIHF
jgi:hypothetical protein